MEDEQAPLLRRTNTHRKQRYHKNVHHNVRTHNTEWALAAILLAETFERIAFYGIVGSLVIFLNGSPFNWSSYNATNALFVFTGISYMSSILGGWIADAWFGKFRTIVFFFILYIAGFVFFPLLYPHPQIHQNVTEAPEWCAWPQSATNDSRYYNHSDDQSFITPVLYGAAQPVDKDKKWYPLTPTSVSREVCSWVVYMALVVIAVGNGAVKANISPFGADQVKHKGPAGIRMFVNWFYWCINIGALVSLGGLAYIQQEMSFFWGYIAPNICLVIAMVIFIIGGCVYVRHPPGGSVLTNIFKIFHQSCQKVCCYRRPATYGLVSSAPGGFRETPASCLDYAKIQYGGSYHDNMVDDVKKLGKICVIFLAMVPYWIVYFQMETTFVLQGLHMRLDLNGNGTRAAAKANNFRFPVAWLSLFDVVFLILLLPLFDRVIYPRLDRRGYVLSPRIRIVIGMVFSMLAVATAGFIEMYRLSVYWRNDTDNIYWQVVGMTYYRAADVTILLQIPQYALIGISEVFASVAGLEIAYVLAPHTMQGLITGLFWFTQGIGAMLGSGILQAFRGLWFFSWDHGDINCRHLRCPTPADPDARCSCHLDYYFFLLAGLQLVGILVFALITWKMDLGLRSMYSRNNNNLVDSMSHVEESDGDSVTSPVRPGYRTFSRRVNQHSVSGTDTPETDSNHEFR